ncbi:MAG: SRPBCC family protein [Myxococcales bacterium]|nr:SRPBCC family protein [Myxococcales bacterium]MCB9520780.1 SRPBCC family protein [Myxococcales bacterium]MCB9532476.1 SRPBCC family protein [Myxococcales bacterium]MCB9533497.1 SRPBCC family protein [Myxococcales bacterium]
MARYTTTIATPLSVDGAFSFMRDITRFAEWDPGVKRARRVRGDGWGVGTAYELVVDAGTTSVMIYEVTEYEPPHRMVLVSRTRWLTSVDEIRVEPDGAGSRVTYDAVLTLNGRLGRFDGFLGHAFRKVGDRAAAGLRTALASAAA